MSIPTKEITVAVLPIRNLSANQELSYFVNGFTEDLITDLSRFRGIGIIASHSTQQLQFGDNQEEISNLGADYLVHGSFRQLGEQVQIRIHLVLAQTGTLIWGERYDEQLDRIFQVHEAIIEQIVHILQRQINANLLASSFQKNSASLAAYDHWLRGMDELRKGGVEHDLAARNHFEQALSVDPNYARAYTGISLTYFNEWSCQLWDRWEVSQQGAQEYALKAIEIDEDDYVALAVLGRTFMYEAQYDKAEHCLRKSLRLNPNDADNLILIASCFVYLGLVEEAEVLYQKALRLNPFCPDWYYAYGAFIYFELGDNQKALSIGKKVHLDHAWVDFGAYLAAVCYLEGDFQQMEVYWQHYLEQHRNKILASEQVDQAKAVDWFRNVNPYKDKTNLVPFWEYLGAYQAIQKPAPATVAIAQQTRNQFQKNGELWEVRFQGKSATLVEVKGFYDIHQLLAESGKAFHCTELMGTQFRETAGAVLIDQQAKQEYRARIRQLQTTIEEAEALNHQQQLMDARMEYENLLDHLSAAMSLGGRSRKVGSTTEKARSAVTWRIRSAIKKIEAVHPELAEHFSQHIKTGTTCSYQSPIDLDWQL